MDRQQHYIGLIMSDPVKPKTVQLTRPKWGTHDQQVKYEELVEDMM